MLLLLLLLLILSFVYYTGWPNESSLLSLRSYHHYVSFPDWSCPYDVTLFLEKNEDIFWDLISWILTYQWLFNMDTDLPLSMLVAFVHLFCIFIMVQWPTCTGGKLLFERSATVLMSNVHGVPGKNQCLGCIVLPEWRGKTPEHR